MAAKKTTILTADDDPQLLRLVARNLVLEDYNVLTAIDGRQALEQIEAIARAWGNVGGNDIQMSVLIQVPNCNVIRIQCAGIAYGCSERVRTQGVSSDAWRGGPSGRPPGLRSRRRKSRT